MTEQEKIEKAAKDFYEENAECLESKEDTIAVFQDAVAWARANPPQEHIKTEGEKKGDDYYKSTDMGAEKAVKRDAPNVKGAFLEGHARGVEEGKAQRLKEVVEYMRFCSYNGIASGLIEKFGAIAPGQGGVMK